MQGDKQKISTQAYPEVWAAIKQIAHEEGRHTDSVVNEAFELLIEKKQGGMLRDHVEQAYDMSLREYGDLYRLLAK